MNETLTKLQTVTVGSGGASSITFSNIPQNYTDLKIVMSLRNNRSGFDRSTLTMRINADTGSNYSSKTLYGADGSSTGASDSASGTYAIIGNSNSTNANANTFSSFTLDIPNYTSSNAKSFSVDYAQESTTSTWVVQMIAGLWNQTSAISSITFNDLANSSSFVQYSTFTLYGIKSLANTFGNSVKATGGTIATDGTYVYHTFNSTSSFVPLTRLVADVLVVAGGGGAAGGYSGGGGGAGGIQYQALNNLTPGIAYTCTVGAGGAGGPSGNGGSGYGSSAGTNGVNSTFGAVFTAIGGGGGGAYLSYGNSANAQSGGSGGGGAGYTSSGGSAVAGTGGTFYGNAGGNGPGGGNTSSGGGGGAGAAGASGVGQTVGGTGGNGLATWSQWGLATSTGQNVGGIVYYAGGGAGASGSSTTAGGYGGGGNGATTGTSYSGLVASGGGGGGNRDLVAGGSGGSGVVIVRYKA